jgi:uncharacterized RDD family membrane protein YckC
MSHVVHRAVKAARPERATPATQAPSAEPSYQGLITRTIAFTLDAAIINLVAMVVGVAVGLALSVLPLPNSLDPVLIVLGGLAYLLWSSGYFVVFWSSAGQTPGDRLMWIRVCMADGGGPPPPFRALVRLGALVLAAIPLFAGFLTILVDDRRRGVHDMIAGTVVVGEIDETPTNDPTASVGDDHLEQHQQQA